MTLEEQVMAVWNNTQKGTPKSLEQAIGNALDELKQKEIDVNFHIAKNDPVLIIKKHVQDFIAQKFNLFMSGDGSQIDTTAQSLWEKIVGIR
jgi:predicted XRE-type DNA-binding protein